MKSQWLSNLWNLAKETVNEFSGNKVVRLSAALAYYSIFSIAPLLIIIIGVAAFFMGEETVRRQMNEQLRGLIGQKSGEAIASMIGGHKQGSSLLATGIGIVALLIGASGVFGQLQ